MHESEEFIFLADFASREGGNAGIATDATLRKHPEISRGLYEKSFHLLLFKFNTYFACLKKRRSSVQKSKKKLDSQNRIAKLIKKIYK